MVVWEGGGGGGHFWGLWVGGEKYFYRQAWPGPVVLLNPLAKLKILVCDLEG